MEKLIFAAVGYLAGAFTPGILRKVKALFTKETAAATTAVTTAVEKKL